MRGTWRRVGDTAIPISPRAKAFLSKIEDSKTFSTEKNAKQVALFFVLCKIVADNTDETTEVIKKRALYQAGYVDTWVDRAGRVHIEAKSIREMKHAEFDRCFKDVIPIMAEWLGNAPDELHDEAMERFNASVEGNIAERHE